MINETYFSYSFSEINKSHFKQELPKLHRALTQWKQLATTRANQAQQDANVPPGKKALARDCEIAISAIVRDLPKLTHKDRIFIACGQTQSIEGIALARFKPEGVELLQLASRPENLRIFGTELAPQRGVGRALVQAIRNRVITDSTVQKKVIKLDSLSTAVCFYQSLGFVRSAHQEDSLRHLPPEKQLTKMKITL